MYRSKMAMIILLLLMIACMLTSCMPGPFAPRYKSLDKLLGTPGRIISPEGVKYIPYGEKWMPEDHGQILGLAEWSDALVYSATKDKDKNVISTHDSFFAEWPSMYAKEDFIPPDFKRENITGVQFVIYSDGNSAQKGAIITDSKVIDTIFAELNNPASKVSFDKCTNYLSLFFYSDKAPGLTASVTGWLIPDGRYVFSYGGTIVFSNDTVKMLLGE